MTRRRLYGSVGLALVLACVLVFPTTAQQVVTRVGGWVTTAAPTYTTNSLQSLSLDTAGNLRVLPAATDVDLGNVDLEIAGTAIAVNAGTNSAQTIRVNEATDSQLSAGIGSTSDSASSVGGTGSGNAKWRLMTTQLGQIETAVEALVTPGININQIGGSDPVFSACLNSDTRTSVNVASVAGAGTVQFAAPTASTRWYFCGGTLRVSAAATVTIISGTGATCGTSTDTFLTARAATDEYVLNQQSDASLFRVGAVGEGFCVTRSASVALDGAFWIVGVAE